MKVLRININPLQKNNSPLNVEASFFIWFCVASFCLVLSLFKEQILPDYFFFDSYEIARHIKDVETLTVANSYLSTAWLYKILGFESNTPGLSFLSTVIIVSFYYVVMTSRRCGEINIFEFSLAIFFLALSVIYQTVLSKDFIVTMMIILFYFFSGSRIGTVCWVGVTLLYAIFFRQYWYLVLFMFSIFCLFYGGFWRNILCVAVGVFALSFLFEYVLGIPADHYRMVVNESRIDNSIENAKTMILPYINGNDWLSEGGNAMITWVFLMAPLPLLAKGDMYYIVISIFIAYLFLKLWCETARNFKSIKHNKLFSLVISFTVIQAFFEPDYGSFVRHLSPFFPLILFCILNKGSASCYEKESAACR